MLPRQYEKIPHMQIYARGEFQIFPDFLPSFLVREGHDPEDTTYDQCHNREHESKDDILTNVPGQEGNSTARSGTCQRIKGVC